MTGIYKHIIRFCKNVSSGKRTSNNAFLDCFLLKRTRNGFTISSIKTFQIAIIALIFLMGSSITSTAQTTITRVIIASSDDAEQTGPDGDDPGGMYLTSTDLELVYDPDYTKGVQTVGLRFTNLTIPVDATITNAYLTFRADIPNSENPALTSSTTVTIKGNDVDDATTFLDTLNNISSRAMTSASVNWTPETWVAGNLYTSNSFVPVIQEIVDRPNWASGNDIALIITGTNVGGRTADSFDSGGGVAPSLTITYTTSPPMTLSTVVTDAVCPGTGAIDVTVDSGGTAPFTYSWTNNLGQSGSGSGLSITGLSAGIYNVSISDDSGLTSNITEIVVGGPAPLNLSYNTSLLSDPSASDGAIDLSVSGGVPLGGPLYTFAWTKDGVPFASTEDLSGLSAGTYAVTVTDACPGNASGSVNIVYTVTKQLYLSDPAQNLDRVDPVATGDETLASSEILYSCPNMLTNTEFDNGTSNWNLYNQNGNSSTWSVDNTSQLSGVNSAKVDITTVTGTDWHVQLDQETFVLNAGEEYVVYFDAKASVARTIGMIIQERTEPWDTYINETVNLTTSATTYGPFTFTPSEADPIAGILFNLGGSTGTVYIDNVKLFNNCSTYNNSTTFSQGTPMCTTLDLENGTTVNASLHLLTSGAAVTSSSDISAILRYGNTTIANLTNAGYTGGTTGVLTLSGTLTNGIMVPAGESIEMEVITNEPLALIAIQYDSQTKPSKIEFSTSTYIDIISYDVYDAPYPGGNIITGTTTGNTVYPRAVVTDPFGFSDITGLDIDISGTPVSATSVATSGCTRTYEYTWNTTGLAGSYSIPATAKEGYEDVVTDVQDLSFEFCSPIVGTPVFAAGATSTRCQAAENVTYAATATDATGLTYSLDAASLAANNTINTATGEVTFDAGYTGTSIITATAVGCGGPMNSTHTVTTNGANTTPVFILGSSSTRCQAIESITYTATSDFTFGITYALDAASISGGNTINASNGEVTYAAGWFGTSVITATSAGCSGSLSASHTVTIDESIGNVLFVSGASSSRCQGAANVNYSATSSNSTGMSYSLDAASISAGNTINTSTGVVTYIASWTGTSLITATATGCNGPNTATHTVTITPSVGNPVFVHGSTSQRCKAAGNEPYPASSTNTTGITFSLDATSLAAGNTINSSTGTVSYTSGWTGTSTITASAAGCNGPTIETHTAVTVAIEANDDSATGTQGSPTPLNLLSNDQCDINSSTLAIVIEPANGNVQVGMGGEILYLPNGNFDGVETFTYEICSYGPTVVCDTATVTITMDALNGDPCAEATDNKTYYLPFPEDTDILRKSLWSAASVSYVSGSVRSIISLKFPYPGTTLTYDHWEDGYESDIHFPSQSTTMIWGDGDLTNGVAPGYPTDIIPAGGYIYTDNTFPYNPRNPANIFYDGKDKMYTSADIAVSKIAGDAGTGGGSTTFDVQNVKTNVYDISRFGQLFVIPFGEDMTLGGTGAFKYTGVFIRAATDGTVVNLDYDGDNTVDLMQTLDEGEVWFYDGTASTPGIASDVNNANDIKAGATITSNFPVGVDLIFGGIDAYGTRNLALLPGDFYGSTYYSPVYRSLAGLDSSDEPSIVPVYVFFTNTLSTPMTVRWTDKDGVTGDIVVPANGSNYFDLPFKETGYKFESLEGQAFTAVSVIDADISGSTYDWSFNLISTTRLTSFTSIAWAPGSNGLSGNYAPVWVTPTANTTLYVKYDGDLTTTPNTPLNACNLPYDAAFSMNSLEAIRLLDSDNDQTGLAIYTCDDVTFAAVWGEDPNAGGPSPYGTPAMDVGYVLEPRCLKQLIFANDDIKPTLINTPVDIDVDVNDFGFLCLVDPSSVSTFGLMQPSNGSVVENGDGSVTYTPNPGFTGIDEFEYRICSSDYPTLCDVATVRVPVTCSITNLGENDINGTVYIDDNIDMDYSVGELGQSGVTVILYEDNNEDGEVDGGDTQVDTDVTDGSGNYSFSVTLPASNTSLHYEDISGGIAINSSIPCSSPLSRTISVPDNMIITDVNFGFNADHTYRGDIKVILTSPQGTSVEVINGGTNDNNSNFDIILDDASGSSLNDGNTDNTASPYYDRTVAPDNALSAFNGENAAGDWIIEICDEYTSADNGIYHRSRLSLIGDVASDKSYVLAVDLATLPTDFSLTTDNMETAVFNVADLSDCENEFGIVNLCIHNTGLDTDGDGLNDICDLDDDNDGILDTNECSEPIPCDTDMDGAPDHLDLDSDNDGCTDADEAYASLLADNDDGGIYGPGIPTIANGLVDANGLVISAGVTGSTYNTIPATVSGGQNTFQEAVVLGISSDPVNLTECVGSTATFTAIATASILVTDPVTTASTNVNYQWQLNGVDIVGASGTSASGSVITYTTPPLTIGDNGNVYNVKFTNEATICVVESSGILTVNELPICNASNNGTFCSGGVITLNETGGEAISWSWSSNGSATFDDNTLQSPVASGAVNGEVFTVLITDINGCQSSCQTTAVTNPLPVCIVSNSGPICTGESLTLYETGTDAVSWEWTSNGSALFNSRTVQSPVASFVADGEIFTVVITDSNGCQSTCQTTAVVNPLPVCSVSDNGPICLGGDLILSETGAEAVSWTWSSNGNAIFNDNTLQSPVATGAADGEIFTVQIIDINGCLNICQTMAVVDTLQICSASNDGPICPGEDLTLSETGTETVSWFWSSNGSATFDNNTLQNPVASGATDGEVFTVRTTDINGCISICQTTALFQDDPTVTITGPNEICVGDVTQLSSSESGGFWSSSDTDIAIISISGVVVGVSAGTASFTYTSVDGCISSASGSITVVPEVDVAIDFNGSICLKNNSQLSAIATGGTAGYTYSWAGPSSFSSTLQTISLTESGNYSVTVTDAKGCNSSTTVLVHESYDPFIFALNTDVCEDEEVTLSIGGGSGTLYQWGPNANNATTPTVTVTPGLPSTTYMVTVTNSIGCESTASATINVISKPVVNIIGSDDICVGSTTQLSPSTGGLWTSSNYTVLNVSNSGLVTGVGAGTATLTFQDSTTNCYSNPTENINVTDNTHVTLTGENQICLDETPILTASVAGGTWSSSDNSIASIDLNTGEVTPVTHGSVVLTYVSPTTGCYNVATHNMDIHDFPNLTVNGPSTICEGSITYVGSSTSGTWTSSDENVATVSAIGEVIGVGPGTVTFSFVSNIGCASVLGTPITVVANPVISLTGPDSLCIDETTTLSPTTGGVWISSNNNVASVTSDGVVTAKAAGTASFTFIELINGCISSNNILITVNAAPSIASPSSNVLCKGETANIYPTSGGVWTSSDSTKATITNDGLITAISSGTVTFEFTNDLTGCNSAASSPVVIQSAPTINFSGPTTICVNETTSISPSVGGYWSSTDVSKATINNEGIITGVSSGTVRFIFTNSSSGCVSDTSDVLTILSPAIVEVTGPSSVCIGEISTLSPSSGGTWTSDNTAIATVDSNGVITGVSAGTVTFTFLNDSGCSSEPTDEVIIESSPTVEFLGSSSICIGDVTTLNPSTYGSWTSSDTTIATITNNGIATAIAPGTVTLTFTNTNTGCIASETAELIVNAPPSISISGNTEICIGGSTNLQPSTGGTWTSSNSNIATILSNGTVTGITAGDVTFTFVESSTGCISAESAPVTVLAKPTVSVEGSNTICVGSSTTLSPSTGGTWSSDNESVATVTNDGVVTGVGLGIAKFTFTTTEGCASNQTSPIIVYDAPSISIDGSTILCVGENVQMLPSIGGTWSSSNISTATIDNNGVVTAVAPGTVTFTYTDASTGCTSEESDSVTVIENPATVLTGPSNICIGATTNFSPTTGGVWTSVNPTIAWIDNNGEVTGIASGSAQFIFTDLSTGCISDTTTAITVTSESTPVFNGPESICIGDTSYISPSTGGTWISTDTSVATITNEGMIIGVGPGTSEFQFTNSTSGCISDFSSLFTVNAIGTVYISGNSIICIGSTTTLYPSTGGTWESLNPGIASVTNDGLVTGISAGSAFFVFTDSISGCSSDGSLEVEVQNGAAINISGDSELCIGYTMTLTPSTGGFWTSNNENIATITNSGIVSGIAPGKVTFTFTESSSGCINESTSDSISIRSCMNHDFNVALVNQEIFGDISTNDDFPIEAIYNNTPQLISKPEASLVNFIINADGSYSFEGSKSGNYRYNIPICLDSIYSGCQSSMIEITLVENQYSTGNPVTNLDIATTFAVEGASKSSNSGGTFDINSIQNDVCIYTLGCGMDWSTVWIDENASNGLAEIAPSGVIEYTPDEGFIGFDTIYYGMCADGYANCNTTMQVITVNHATASNTVIASDDFTFTLRGSSISGNVLNNDTDAEGDSIFVTSQGSLMAPIVVSSGEYYIDALGNFNFTPNDSFSGHTEIIYQICDDNADQACMEATLHLLVFDDISVSLRVYLEGALMQNNGAVSATGLPLMRDDLRVSPYTGENYLPLFDPYSIAADPWAGTHTKFNKIGPGELAENKEITDSLGVFGVTGDNAIVDWVHVELRSKDNMAIPIATRSGLLQRDGDVVDLDGVSNLRFNAVNVDSFYVVVKHRSHLGVMSQKVSYSEVVDFTSPQYPVYNFGVQGLNDFTGLSQNTNVKSGYCALWAGDFDSNGKIKFTNPGDDQNVLFIGVLFNSPDFLINYDQAYGYLTGDYNMNSKSKYTNPSDDINFLFAQILLYPLNTSFLSNYNSLIEQVPDEE